ncbi:helix-turn-helix domain-containing protein [Candidatus Contendibacter odensensis]|uniref:Transposase putative helix-turn-helix domain-containing protein n=1 Tax=Candidatus Contendobacter odensis Run_B_J11 TaxID=1400861 RepID=A0A7U7J2M1_9GAMM|nr:helix-turn-helix domain-containing protein [Candidatus Contendobacter odensis]CDH43473.1 hypothetical protein BN874_1210003 [Candidatus Contendobacter odensis Run_B_J11]
MGASRFAYNWALAEWQRQFEAGEKPNEAALRRQFNALKPLAPSPLTVSGFGCPKSAGYGCVRNCGLTASRCRPP